MFKDIFLKRVGFITCTTLISTLLAAVPISGANAAPEVSATTTTNPVNTEMVGTVDGHLISAAVLANTAVTHTADAIASGASVARSVGLISQDSASGVGQYAGSSQFDLSPLERGRSSVEGGKGFVVLGALQPRLETPGEPYVLDDEAGLAEKTPTHVSAGIQS